YNSHYLSPTSTKRKYLAILSLSTFCSSKCFECHFLGLCQSLYAFDIHTLVGPVASERFDAGSRLHFAKFGGSIVATTSNGGSIGAESNRPYAIIVSTHNL